MRQPLLTLHIERLTQGGRAVLCDVDLKIYRGDHIAILGRSGAGKSTLLQRLQRCNSDEIALCPQRNGLVEALSSYNNIYMGGLDRHPWWYNLLNLLRPWARNRRQIGDICRLLGIEQQLLQSVDQLSGGQRQRVAIGRALYQDRPIFFGDEAVASVDPVQAKQLIDTIQQRHHSTVQVLHQRPLALACSNRIIGLKDGRICIDAPTDQLTIDDLTELYL
ncbi:phosphonate transport system ATP-binding protein [Sinobacterium caligoides]|uniref:Phosphonate transport system ATP-binding protein n=1 Tax=Sinobacterium caligoides TaxID=933926 RepID=A0A3N2DGR1_9GAMM|nr:ATP-binding cassette domain-containing protein [Sinobacterium caligoides]ROR98962.1 phosphonate transport system ATP-binding protein [Sinobacterium caligoides]